VNLDEDVLDRARALAEERDMAFRAVVNEALRAGLDQIAKPAERRRYRTEPHPMGLRKGRHLDNIQELLAQAEGEGFR